MIPASFLLANSDAANDALPAFLKSGAAGILIEGGLFMWPILILLVQKGYMFNEMLIK